MDHQVDKESLLLYAGHDQNKCSMCLVIEQWSESSNIRQLHIFMGTINAAHQATAHSEARYEWYFVLFESKDGNDLGW